MPTDVAVAQLAAELTVRIVSEPGEIRALGECGVPFGGNDREPGFFLGSVPPNWSPRVAVVSSGAGVVVGLVYLRERTVAGLSSGIVQGDGTFDTMIVAADGVRDQVFARALESLIGQGNIRGIRLIVPPGESAERLARQVAVEQGWDWAPSEIGSYHVRLALPGSYEDFLLTLGSRTRRNFRHHRRQFEAAGHEFVERMTAGERRAAVLHLRERCSLSNSLAATEAALQWTESVARPWAVGLKHQTGEWLGVACGCLLPGRAVMFVQYNHDREHQQLSLSSVLRGYLVESLMEWGYPELVFWLGAAGPLARYAEPYPARRLYLDRPSLSWRAIRAAARQLGPRLTEEARWHDLSWVAPLSPTEVTWAQE